MKLSIKTTFDFGKLSNKIPNVLEEYLKLVANNSAKDAKDNISKGLKPPLRDSTLEIRKYRGTGGSTPLRETDALFNSIKGTPEGLQMLQYGVYHNEGYRTSKKSMIPNKKVPARPFISPSEKTVAKLSPNFMREINRALKK